MCFIESRLTVVFFIVNNNIMLCRAVYANIMQCLLRAALLELLLSAMHTRSEGPFGKMKESSPRSQLY
jgi:hypothetical protein